MKIEMGESLFYSWLRHVKECQIVQTNWKVSPQWRLQNEDALDRLARRADALFSEKYGYKIFKQNASLSQVLLQGECDAVGISIQFGRNQVYAVDVAFHEAGLNYGTREQTVMKIIAKSIRTAMCLYGYMGCRDAEIIFASPKINPAILGDATPCIEDLNRLFQEEGYYFKARIIANEEFNSLVLQPILLISDGIADTSELFLRSYQMFTMFSGTPASPKSAGKTEQKTPGSKPPRRTEPLPEASGNSTYAELKIGKLAQVVLRKLLENGAATDEEIGLMQTVDYSKKTFDLQYPLLVDASSDFDAVRYYVKPLAINGKKYMLCSQWFETSANNDRPFLDKWIEEHEG